ncbi:unnamed protein product [Cylindrotheca closterium]|uniref:Uncharacterized protein n=1 Tax=Cylindrotheca closterium TaxID=2856 RepID=A0AAD2JIK4_9STRA|nr:unnamed protein product [Cylindrotheca closterium]
MKDSITNPPEKDPNSIMTVADQGQGGLEEKTRSNLTTQSSIALTKDNPAITTPKRSSKRTPSPTAEDGVMKGRSLFPSEVAQGQDGPTAKARSDSTTPLSINLTKHNPNRTTTKSQRKQPPPSKTAEGWRSARTAARCLHQETQGVKVSPALQEGLEAGGFWESRIHHLVLSHRGSLWSGNIQMPWMVSQLRFSMQNLFSLGDLENADDDKGSWSLCEYFLCLATQCPTVVFDVATAQRVIKTDKKSPRFWEFSLVFNPTLIVQRAEPLMWMWLAAAKFFAHPWTGPAIIPPIVEEFERLERESKIAKAQSKSKKRPASTPEDPKGAKAHDSRPPPYASPVVLPSKHRPITPEIGRRRKTNWSLANSAHSFSP